MCLCTWQSLSGWLATSLFSLLAQLKLWHLQDRCHDVGVLGISESKRDQSVCHGNSFTDDEVNPRIWRTLSCIKKLRSMFCVIGTAVVFKGFMVQRPTPCSSQSSHSFWSVEGSVCDVVAPQPEDPAAGTWISDCRGVCFWQGLQVRRRLGWLWND